jgi:hypothetical protein
MHRQGPFTTIYWWKYQTEGLSASLTEMTISIIQRINQMHWPVMDACMGAQKD